MAKAITKKQIKEIPIFLTRKQGTSQKTGYIFFSPGSYTFSGIIQRLTKSAWSHVAIVYKDEELGRVWILEAEPKIGIQLIPLSKYLHNYKGIKRPYKGQVVLAN